jgi:hypothetical protein
VRHGNRKRLIAFFVLCLIFLTSCSSNAINTKLIKDLYVDDFSSDDSANCTTFDVDLTHLQALLFFKRARAVEYKILHRHYELAPCYIEGPLTYEQEACYWEIQAGATGSIKCNDREWYFVCDNCDDLFQKK